MHWTMHGDVEVNQPGTRTAPGWHKERERGGLGEHGRGLPIVHSGPSNGVEWRGPGSRLGISGRLWESKDLRVLSLHGSTTERPRLEWPRRSRKSETELWQKSIQRRGTIVIP